MVDQLVQNIIRIVRGKDEQVALVVACLLAEGHVLIEDCPGVGKTTIARALAKSISGSSNRIQFTPDLLPSDVTGSTVYDQSSKKFEFHPGAVFANIVVGDEINRASPKTQSALLQVMEERQITVDGTTYDVPRPFVVVATQNPIEMDGTYRLPEAQLDRFLMRISLGYPSRAATLEIMQGYREGQELEDLRSVTTTDQVEELVRQASKTYVDPQVQDYIVRVAEATREARGVRLGVSPRGCLSMLRAVRAWAFLQQRDFVIPDDVQRLVEPVLAHRLILTPQAELEGLTANAVLAQVLSEIDVPQRAKS